MTIIKEKLTRRNFFKQTGKLVASTAAVTTLSPLILTQVKGLSKTASKTSERESQDVRMQHDLERALAKPIEQRKWTMFIDIEKCVGCNACTVACMAENNLPPGVSYRKVFDSEFGEYPDVQRFFMPTNCMQCENAPCISAANDVVADAMGRRPDGIVTIDYEKFRGRKVFEAAKKACPYTALYYDEGKYYTGGTPVIEQYEKRTVVEYGKEVNKGDMRGVGRKCHFCLHRIDSGILPACVATCLGQAMYFGDANDSEALVTQKVKLQSNHIVKEKAGTHPRIPYTFGNADPSKVKEICKTCHE